MTINFKFLGLTILIINLNCYATDSIINDSGVDHRLAAALPELPVRPTTGAYLHHRERADFKIWADTDWHDRIVRLWSDAPVVNRLEVSNFSPISNSSVSHFANHLRQAKIGYYAGALVEIYNQRPFDAVEKIFLEELTGRLK